MNPPSPSTAESETPRLLHDLRALATAGDPGFDALARLAASQTGCPVGDHGSKPMNIARIMDDLDRLCAVCN